jgi:hypothetical protein
MSSNNHNNTESLDISDYTVPELMELVNLEKLDPTAIKEKTKAYIEKFKEENNSEMADFFLEVQAALLNAFGDTTIDAWYSNEYLTTPDQPFQNAKITSRQNKTQEFDGALKREQIAINQSKPLPFAQGEINPTLRNQIRKIMNIDSTYRPNNIPALKSLPFSSEGIWNASHFTASLSENLTRVLSLQLYSIQIPYTWYNVNEGTNCLIYKDVFYSIPPGNYTIDTLKTALDTVTPPELTLNIDGYPVTGKVQFDSTSITVENLVFFSTNDGCEPCASGNYINDSLGWLLGFREPCYQISVSQPARGEAVVDLFGPKFLLLYLDEFNMNRINKGLVSIEDSESKLNLPSYYKAGNLTTEDNNLQVTKPDCITPQQVIGGDCIDQPYPVKTPFFTQDLPRTLTQAQQYTVNQIIQNRKNSPNLKLTGPNPNNIMALIPVKRTGVEFGGMIIENNNSLTFNTRNYFGPVDIERIEVKLLDDRGNLLQLNGSEWSFSIITTQLYQY